MSKFFRVCNWVFKCDREAMSEYLFFNMTGRMLRNAKMTRSAMDWNVNASVVEVSCCNVVPACKQNRNVHNRPLFRWLEYSQLSTSNLHQKRFKFSPATPSQEPPFIERQPCHSSVMVFCSSSAIYQGFCQC